MKKFDAGKQMCCIETSAAVIKAQNVMTLTLF